MKSFHFPLQKAWELRNRQLELEEVRYKQQLAEVAQLDRQRVEVEASGMRAETQVRELRTVASCDLMALGNFRLRARKLAAQIGARRIEAAEQLEAQQK